MKKARIALKGPNGPIQGNAQPTKGAGTLRRVVRKQRLLRF